MNAIFSSIRRLAAADRTGPGTAVLVGAAHGTTHWINATLYILLPFIRDDLGLTYTEAGSLVTVFFAASVVANVGAGPLVDLSGRYVGVQALSLVFGAVGLGLVALADRMAVLVLAVVLIGICISLWHPAAITFLSRRYPGSRGLALSVHTVGASLGDMVAPATAGFLLLALSWQGTALVTALPLFAMAGVLVFALKEIERPAGDGSAAAGLGGYFKGVGGLVRDPALIRLCVVAGLWSMAQSGLLVFVPLYLVGELDTGPAVVGVAAMIMQVGGVFGGPVAGAWSDRIGRRPVVLAALAAATVFVVAMTLVGGMIAFIALASLVALALFSIRSVIHSWLLDMTPEGASGSAISILFAAQSAFTMLVPVLGGVIADVWGLAAVFHFVTAICAAATVMLLAMPKPAGVAEKAA